MVLRDFQITRNDIFQYFVTIIIFFATILLPIVNYFTFKNSLIQGVQVGELEQRYDLIIVLIIVIGIITSIITYLVFYYPKYSLRRGYLTLSQSILDVIFFVVFAQMSSVSVYLDGSGIVLNLGGVYILLIIAFLPFVFKNIFDVFDFRKNKEFYQRKLRAKAALLLKEGNRKIKCKNCSYICRKGWKKCPICNTKL